MPTIVTGEALQQAVQSQTFIKSGDPKHAEGVKYDLTLGNMLLRAGSGPVDVLQLSEVERGQLVVHPGEVVFALTQEKLDLGPNMMAQLSPKRSISHSGIIVIGGFCIDPGYRGNLLLGLYNLSSTPYRLLPGRRVIAASFYFLEGTELGEFPTPKSLDEFPPELIQMMEKYKPEGSQALVDGLRRVETEVGKLWTEVTKHDRFEEALSRHDTQIEKLLASLTAEAEARKSGDDSLSKTVSKMDDTLSKFVFFGKWLIGIATAILVAWLLKLFGLV